MSIFIAMLKLPEYREKELIDEDDSWYWSEEWQQMEREADEDIKAGRIKSFENVEDLIRELKLE